MLRTVSVSTCTRNSMGSGSWEAKLTEGPSGPGPLTTPCAGSHPSKSPVGSREEGLGSKAFTHPASCEPGKPDDPGGAGHAGESWHPGHARDSDVSLDSFDVAWLPWQAGHSGQPGDPRHSRDTCGDAAA